MSPLSDRMRRILSDAPLPPGPADGTAAAPRAGRARALRRRLAALGLDRGPDVPSAPDDRGTWEGADDDRPLEVQVDGEARHTHRGPFLFAEQRIPLTRRHGDRPLDEALAYDLTLSGSQRRGTGPRTVAVREAVFLDTETTGLAGGTGTVAFLVGTGRIEGDDFVIRQYCMRDFPEEEALLHALTEDLEEAPLVTFNGRSFDWPLLTTRWKLHRMAVPNRPHIDLLPPARRLWVDSVPSHTLGTLEEHVLGLQRENDLPGWRIPAAYFDYLRTGRAGLVALAFRHNATDVVSMLALVGHMGRILDAPEARPKATARDFHGTARLLLDLEESGKARRSLEAGLERAAAEDGVALRRLLGHMCRRAGDYDEALDQWIQLARTAPRFDAEAFEQVAKLYEHRRRDFPRALKWAEEALRNVAPGSKAEEAFRHRKARLNRRMGS